MGSVEEGMEVMTGAKAGCDRLGMRSDLQNYCCLGVVERTIGGCAECKKVSIRRHIPIIRRENGDDVQPGGCEWRSNIWASGTRSLGLESVDEHGMSADDDVQETEELSTPSQANRKRKDKGRKKKSGSKKALSSQHHV